MGKNNMHRVGTGKKALAYGAANGFGPFARQRARAKPKEAAPKKEK